MFVSWASSVVTAMSEGGGRRMVGLEMCERGDLHGHMSFDMRLREGGIGHGGGGNIDGGIFGEDSEVWKVRRVR